MTRCQDCARCVNPEEASETFHVLWCKAPRMSASGTPLVVPCNVERLFGWPVYLFKGTCGRAARFFEQRVKE